LDKQTLVMENVKHCSNRKTATMITKLSSL